MRLLGLGDSLHYPVCKPRHAMDGMQNSLDHIRSSRQDGVTDISFMILKEAKAKCRVVFRVRKF